MAIIKLGPFIGIPRPLSQQQAVQDLTVLLEDHPRRGGQTPHGLKLLRANGAAFERVAEVVRGIEIDAEPCNSKSMHLAEEVSLEFGWQLDFDDQTYVAAYLLTCLIRLGYYKPRYLARVGYVLDVIKPELLDSLHMIHVHNMSASLYGQALRMHLTGH